VAAATASKNAAAATALLAALTPTRTEVREALESIGTAWRDEVREQIHPHLAKHVNWRMDSDTTGHLELSAIAFFQEAGTKPHSITAVNAPMLRFFWKRKNIPMRIKTVQHPGQKPKHFVREAFYSYKVNRAIALAPAHLTITTSP
jgi:hypothetical protein